MHETYSKLSHKRNAGLRHGKVAVVQAKALETMRFATNPSTGESHGGTRAEPVETPKRGIER